MLQRIIGILAQSSINAKLIATTGPGSASLQVQQQIDAGCDLIIAAGGDGTINDVANGMLGTPVPLAILPGGTANVLAREIRLPIQIEDAAAEIANLQLCRIAAGILSNSDWQQRCFVCMAGAGLDAEIVSHIDVDLKARAGKLAYYLGGLAQVFRPLREFEVVIDGKRFEASFALISRVRNYGGDLEIARTASLLRNDFEVVLFRGTFSVQYLRYLAGVIFRRVDRMKGCTVLRAQSVICKQPPVGQVFVQIDGELAGSLPLSAEIVPDALTMLVPRPYLMRERLYTAVPVCAGTL